MPRTPNENPSAATLRKRAQRERERAADADAVKARQREYARAYRARKAAERTAGQAAAAAAVGLDAAAAAAVPAAATPARALADARRQICDDVGSLLNDFFKLRISDADEMRAAFPVLRAQVIAVADKTRVKLANAIAVNTLADRLAEHSAATEKEPADRKTFFDYGNRLLHLQQLHTGNPAETLSLETFRDVEGVWGTIQSAKAARGPNKGKPLALASKLVYAGAVAGVLRRLAGFETEHAEYSKRYTALHATYDEERKNNKLTTAEREKFVSWPTVVGHFHREARGPSKLSARDLALYGIYSAIPPRRVLDYSQMRIAWAKKNAVDVEELDRAANWLILSKEGNPQRMIINRYKTSKRYGTYTREEIPAELAKALADHIRAAKLGHGSPLFPTAKGGHFTHGGLSNLVGALFERVTGHRASVNILRHAAITHFLRAKHRTVAEKEAFAREMAHSVGMQALYDRVDVDAADDVSEASDDEDEDGASAPAAKPVAAKTKPIAAKTKPTAAEKQPAAVQTRSGRQKKTPARYLG